MSALYWATFILTFYGTFGASIYVDTGNPYAVGKLKTGELTLTKDGDNSPKHCKVYFPLEAGDYATVYFVGGFKSLVLAEYYSIVLRKIAEHGFFVFGIDYDYPFQGSNYDQDVNIYFEQLEFFKKYVKTVSTPRYDTMGLLCHSAGCDRTLRMIEDGRMKFNSTAFLDPQSTLVRSPVIVNNIPGLMYASYLSEKGLVPCSIPSMDFRYFFNDWGCPRIAIEAADFGHCDFLDPLPYDVCTLSHFCVTRNDMNTTIQDHFRETVQGIVTSFFMTTLQGRPDAFNYIVDESKIPIKLASHHAVVDCANKK